MRHHHAGLVTKRSISRCECGADLASVLHRPTWRTIVWRGRRWERSRFRATIWLCPPHSSPSQMLRSAHEGGEAPQVRI